MILVKVAGSSMAKSRATAASEARLGSPMSRIINDVQGQWRRSKEALAVNSRHFDLDQCVAGTEAGLGAAAEPARGRFARQFTPA
ncbi:MAG: hypothetical protein IPJ62_03925 [Betaproteobacteria bacterium]|nr:hypothetical protein [Betaproteobacteria bacterium]